MYFFQWLMFIRTAKLLPFLLDKSSRGLLSLVRIPLHTRVHDERLLKDRLASYRWHHYGSFLPGALAFVKASTCGWSTEITSSYLLESELILCNLLALIIS
jgi:hypothetical protein